MTPVDPNAPRRVCARLACALFGTSLLKFGATFFAPLTLFSLALVWSHAAEWRITRAATTTPASDVRVDTQRGKSDPMHILRYSFVDEHDEKHWGEFATSSASFAPNPDGSAPELTIEYDPAKPWLNRVRGGQYSMLAGGSFMGIALLALWCVSLGMVRAGWRQGSRLLRLLRFGHQGAAQVVACQVSGQEPVSLEEFRSRFGQARVSPAARGCLLMWTAAIAALVLLVVVVAGWWMTSHSLAAGLLLLYAFAAPGTVMATTFYDPLGVNEGTCTLTIPLPDGTTLRVSSPVAYGAGAVEATNEPVLFDPGSPAAAILLRGLRNAIQADEAGVWHAALGRGPLLQACLLAVIVIGGILLWLGSAVGLVVFLWM